MRQKDAGFVTVAVGQTNFERKGSCPSDGVGELLAAGAVQTADSGETTVSLLIAVTRTGLCSGGSVGMAAQLTPSACSLTWTA